MNQLYSRYLYKFNTFGNLVQRHLRYYTTSMSKGTKHKIAICQLTQKADKNENFDASKKLITEAKQAGAQVIYDIFVAFFCLI